MTELAVNRSLAETISFQAVEQIEELTRELNWSTEYRQLEPGAFSSRFEVLDRGSWFLLEEQSSRCVEVQTGGLPDMYVLALAEGVPAVVNGMTISQDHIYFQCPDADVRATVPAGFAATQLGIATDRFEEAVNAVAPELLLPRRHLHVLAVRPGILRGLRFAMRQALFAPMKGMASRDETVSKVLAELIAVIADHRDEPIVRVLHRASARRALDRAREYIEAHLEQTVRVEALCSYAGTTLRTLERVFAREMGMSPQKYVKARRLNAVRRRLVSEDGLDGRCVTDVALSHGFSHLGRFAGDYHRHFGEYPRETLDAGRFLTVT